MDSVKLRILAPSRYVIDVEPIPPRNKNNREVHLDYLKHLKKSVETLCEIVKEAKRTNVPVPPSTGVNSCNDASGSQLDKQYELKSGISKRQIGDPCKDMGISNSKNETDVLEVFCNEGQTFLAFAYLSEPVLHWCLLHMLTQMEVKVV
ncbi:hypothetical protein Tco_1383326 [Tanacetum coccineum]